MFNLSLPAIPTQLVSFGAQVQTQLDKAHTLLTSALRSDEAKLAARIAVYTVKRLAFLFVALLVAVLALVRYEFTLAQAHFSNEPAVAPALVKAVAAKAKKAQAPDALPARKTRTSTASKGIAPRSLGATKTSKAKKPTEVQAVPIAVD